MWPYREGFMDDLLIFLAGEGSWFSDRPVLDPETFAVASTVVTDNAHLLGSLKGRRSLLCEVVRITVEHNYQTLTDSSHWRLHMALASTLGSTRSGEARWRIAAALEDSQRRSRESIVAVLEHLSVALGARLRDPSYTLDHVQISGGLLVQMLALRNVQVRVALSRQDADGVDLSEPAYVNDLINQTIPGPGLNGEPAQWTLVALSYLGIVDTFLELDPGWVPPGAGPAR
jgi:hypothetical protein